MLMKYRKRRKITASERDELWRRWRQGQSLTEIGRALGRRAFLSAHWGAICASDFFTVEVLMLTGLVRYSVLFVIDLKSRRVEIAGIVRQPTRRG